MTTWFRARWRIHPGEVAIRIAGTSTVHQTGRNAEADRGAPVLARRVLAACGLLLLACGVGIATAAPARAETTMTARLLAGRNHLPGRSVGIAVSVSADQLLEGELLAGDADREEDESPLRVLSRTEVQVPGSSTKEFVVIVPAVPADVVGDTVLKVELRAQDGTVLTADAMTLTTEEEVESVGVLPNAMPQDELPESVPLRIGDGRAELIAVPAVALDEGPEALAQLSTLVAGAGELAALPERARDTVLRWVQAGGHLMGDEVAAPIAGLPDAWQPEGSSWHAAGAGEVRAIGGAAASGRWADVLEPTGTSYATAKVTERAVVVGTEGVTDRAMRINMNGFPEPAGDQSLDTFEVLAMDAGFRVPDASTAFWALVPFIVVAGPVLLFGLSRLRRERYVWVAIPAVAAVLTAGMVASGPGSRVDADGAHATLIEVTPIGATAYTSALLGSVGGGPSRIDLPAGWHTGGSAIATGERAAANSSETADLITERMFGGGMPREATTSTTTASEGPGGPASRQRAIVTGDADHPGTQLSLAPGEFATFSASGPVEAPQLKVEAWAESGVVHGTVSNATGVDLHHVGVLVGNSVEVVGDIASGETKDFELRPVFGGLFAEREAFSFSPPPEPEPEDVDAFNRGCIPDLGEPYLQPDGQVSIGNENGGWQCVDDGFRQAPPVIPGLQVGRRGRDAEWSDAVNVGAWLDHVARRGTALRQPDQVSVVAWTDEMPSPFEIDGRRQVSQGRTALLVTAPIELRTDIDRVGIRVERVADAELPIGRKPEDVALVNGPLFRVLLPATVGGRPIDPTEIALLLPPNLDLASVWLGDGWELRGANIFEKERMRIPLTAEMVHDGVVFIRTNAPQRLGWDEGLGMGLSAPITWTAELVGSGEEA